MQLANVVKQGNTGLREASFVILDPRILKSSRHWAMSITSPILIYYALAYGVRLGWIPHAYTAVRLDNLIFINYDQRNKKAKEPNERKIYKIPASTRREHRPVCHHQLARSELCNASGRNISLCTVSEFILDEENEPCAHTAGGIDFAPFMRREYELGRALMTKVSGIGKVSHTYDNGQTEQWTSDQVQALINPEQEQSAWDFLFETLSSIQAKLPTNGEWCTWKKKDGISIVNKGAIDPNNLLPYFREKFTI
ncbi:hypothetical protein PRIPAC_72418 [Pristionchus pacificus]|uniref:Uncharacterized protein n=1 Tax=Pristionchus pacificus TaxID=54126 RepID=A0A2A6BGA9_PRIPA|nr:hypothetical protein PRIPAC_72418 [Pristionchus pacificus]|eukprot:PDM64920.1 hypothetical protein PRIPAC_53176 [Pristionchus pacificus]